MCAADEVPRLAEQEDPRAQVAARQFARQERGESLYLVAWDGDDPIGSGEVLFGATCEVRNLHVQEASRGSGIGSALIAEAERIARARGSAGIRVGAGVGNEAARRLYERLGYEATGLFETTTYTYFDQDGEHQATEVDEWLEKGFLRPGVRVVAADELGGTLA